jgi:predicted transcriptional regulator
MKVLLSIKPEFADRIFDGTKKYEFRKAIFKNPNIKTVIVYASSPVQRVIGEFEIEKILSEHPECLWEMTKNHSGITEQFFFDYFSRREKGFAIKVKKPKLYKRSLNLQSAFNTTPPQSFMYV